MAASLKEIRFLTANYHHLQGLKLIPFGLFFVYAAFFVNENVRGPDLVDLGSIEPLVEIGILAALAILYFTISTYYRRTFGSVKRLSRSSGEIFLTMAYVCGIFVAIGLDGWLGHYPVSFIVVWMAVPFFWIPFRQHRRYYLAGLGLAVLLFAFPYLYPDSVQLLLLDYYSPLFFSMIGLGCIVIGILDHQMLRHALPPVAEEEVLHHG